MIACRRGLEFASARYVYLVDVLCGSRSSRPLVPLASAFLHAGRHDIDGVEMRFDTGSLALDSGGARALLKCVNVAGTSISSSSAVHGCL